MLKGLAIMSGFRISLLACLWHSLQQARELDNPNWQPGIQDVAYTAGRCTRQATSLSALMTRVSMSL